jgi:uncharacterized protein with PQ loop repeat
MASFFGALACPCVASARAGSVSPMTVAVLGWVAALAYLVRLVPQPVRLARTGVPAGLSPAAALTTVMTDTVWLAYGLHAGLTAVWIVAAAAIPWGVWTAVGLRRQVVGADVALAASWLIATVVAAPFGLVGLVLAASVIGNHGPQVWRALCQSDLTGIAPGTYVIALLDAGLWGAYGIALGDGALIGYGAVLLASALVILARLSSTRTRRATTVATV